MKSLRRRYPLALGALAVAAAAGTIAVASLAAPDAGSPPPEYGLLTDSWPAHNYDLSNSRATTHTNINSTNVAKLHPIWRFKIPGTGVFGNYASAPVDPLREKLRRRDRPGPGDRADQRQQVGGRHGRAHHPC